MDYHPGKEVFNWFFKQLLTHCSSPVIQILQLLVFASRAVAWQIAITVDAVPSLLEVSRLFAWVLTLQTAMRIRVPFHDMFLEKSNNTVS
jgi:hypothetical protein